MLHSKFLISTNWPRMRRIILLVIAWTAGLFLGLYISDSVNASSVSLMRAAAQSSVSIVGLFAVLTFPLMLSAIAVTFSAALVFLPLAFWKALGFAFCFSQIFTAFGSAGWLVRWLLLFSDTCMSVVLLWFWIRNIGGIGPSTKKDLTVCVISVILIGCVDYFVISPFLGTLF